MDGSTPRDEKKSFQYEGSTGSILAPETPIMSPPKSVVPGLCPDKESKQILTNPISMPKKLAPGEKRVISRTLPVGAGTVDISRRARNMSEPTLHISYTSSAKAEEQTILVDEALVEALMTTVQDVEPTSRKFSLSRRSIIKPKKTKINETVTIHRVASSDMVGSKAKTEVYKMIILLREIWVKLDLDNDNHLNMGELKRFCTDIWEEPVEDGGAGVIMKWYAKLDPEKGLNFNEWCLLIKNEDPDMQEFVEEIYEIFVDTCHDADLASEAEH